MRYTESNTIRPRAIGCQKHPAEKGSSADESTVYTTAVRYGYLNIVGEFEYSSGTRFECGSKVIIQTERGIEIGDHISLTCGGCSNSIDRSHMASYAEASGKDYLNPSSGKILREASQEDLNEYSHIREGSRKMMARCEELIKKHKLSMKLIECEHLLGGERIVFYFLSDGRVDFRDLVKDLAGEFHTRIEMRQIGARDEAKLIADYETCGQECCCKTFLKTLKPVNMKMAKLQKATLDPTKVSGRCGRLKCCLRYENESYEELDKNLPEVGVRIKTTQGEGIIVDRQVLTQMLHIETDDKRHFVASVDDILLDDGTPIKKSHEQKTEEPENLLVKKDDIITENSNVVADTNDQQDQEKPKKSRRRRRRKSKRKSGSS